MTAKFGTVVEFNPAADVDVSLHTARPSRSDCLVIGWSYFQAATDGKAMDALLEEHDPILVRRSLKVFGNYASRTDQPQVAAYAALLRDEITVLRGKVAAV